MNKKPIIGIIPTSNYLLTDDSFKDTYRYGNNYIKKIYDNGAIPLLIPYYNNNLIKETLDMCDGLLLPGGNKILNTTLDIIDYFYKNNKPILGICLGMQTLGVYSMKLDNNETRILEVMDNNTHWPTEVTRQTETLLVHNIKIKENTILSKILNTNKTKVNSLHKCHITSVGSKFKISAISEDNIIEGIESKEKDFVLGIQFHPEILPNFDIIFKTFIEKCK